MGQRKLRCHSGYQPMTYLTARLDKSGELRSMNLNDNQVNGRSCAVCDGNGAPRQRVGRLVNGPRIFACTPCRRLLQHSVLSSAR